MCSLCLYCRCEVSVCYKPDSSADWSRGRMLSSQIQPLHPTFCSLLCLPVSTFSGPQPWRPAPPSHTDTQGPARQLSALTESQSQASAELSRGGLDYCMRLGEWTLYPAKERQTLAFVNRRGCIFVWYMLYDYFMLWENSCDKLMSYYGNWNF